ncbi:MAG: hypothetical protein RRY03_01395 [Oscillospiraceae bacterium]
MKNAFVKKILCIIFTLFCLFNTAFAVSKSDNNIIDIPPSWQRIFDDAPIDEKNFSEMSFKDMLTGAYKIVKDKFTQPLTLMARICALLLFAAIARSMCPQDTSSSLYNILEIIIAIAVFSLCAAPVLQIFGGIILQIEELRVYLSSFVPVFSSVLISCGQVGTAAVYSGFFFTAVMMISGFLCKWALPALNILLAFSIVGSICDAMDFTVVTSFVQKIAKWTLTVCATVFISVLSLQSALAQSADSLAMKTGKFLVSAGVPVIGRAVSDAMGSVYTGLKLLKGTAGIALIGVIVLAFLPILAQGMAYYFIFQISALLAKATGGERSAKLFTGISETLSLAMLLVTFFCLMTVLSTILMVVLGSG